MGAERSGELPPQQRLIDFVTSRTVEVNRSTTTRYREGTFAIPNPYRADRIAAAVITSEKGDTGYIALSRNTFDVYIVETPMTLGGQIAVERNNRTGYHAADSNQSRSAIDKLLSTLETMERDGTLVWDD